MRRRRSRRLINFMFSLFGPVPDQGYAKYTQNNLKFIPTRN